MNKKRKDNLLLTLQDIKDNSEYLIEYLKELNECSHSDRVIETIIKKAKLLESLYNETFKEGLK